MFANLTSGLDIHSKALVLRAERQRIIASNIANADTPGYVARDINFKEALSQQIRSDSNELSNASQRPTFKESNMTTHPGHIALSGLGSSQLTGASDLALSLIHI